jgi:CBS domain containing-hemolysin-like protein
MYRRTPSLWVYPRVPSASWRIPISSPLYLIPIILAIDLLITATRAAVLNARQVRLTALNGETDKGAETTLELIKRRKNLRDSLRLSLALLRFLMAGLVLDLLVPVTQNNPTPLNLGALLLIGLIIWIAEFFIERGITRNPEGWSLRLSPIADAISLLMSPILFVVTRIANRGDEAQQLVTITEAELKSFVDVGQHQGVLEQDERRMIFSIFKFGDTLVREIMVPRIDIFAVDVETPIQQAGDALIESGYSRVPVYKGSIDNVQGLLYGKDLLKVWRGRGEFKSLGEILRPAHFVPESKKLDELLAEMQGQRIHMGIVVDEYGGVAGLVTLEDLVEEIVGEIQDEYDLGEEQSYQKISDGEYVFHGRISLDDFNELMGSKLSTENADTLGGYLFSQLGRLPKAEEQIKENGLLLTIEQVSGRRIRRVRAQRVQKPTPPEKKQKKKEANAK